MSSRFSLLFSEPLCSPNDSNRDEHIAMATKIQKMGKAFSPYRLQSVSVGASLSWHREWLWEGTCMGMSFLAGSRMCSPHEAPLINSQGVQQMRGWREVSFSFPIHGPAWHRCCMQDTKAEASLGALMENSAQRRKPAPAWGSRREARGLAGQVS